MLSAPSDSPLRLNASESIYLFSSALFVLPCENQVKDFCLLLHKPVDFSLNLRSGLQRSWENIIRTFACILEDVNVMGKNWAFAHLKQDRVLLASAQYNA